MNNIQTIYNTTRREGGCSMNPITGVVPVKGYMVGDGDNELRVPRIKYADIKAYADKHTMELLKPNVFLGTWKDSGCTTLDISHNVMDLEAAMVFAAVRGEKAIYDVENRVDIEVV